MTLLRSDRAPAPRTLVDIFLESVEQCPDAPALDNGAVVLTYTEFADAAELLAEELARLGIGPGSYVGIRIVSGTADLYVAIMGTLLAGAAYVPVDADDPEERATLVFQEARVDAVIGNDLVVDVRTPRAPRQRELPTPEDDAWVIFTSGSTGTPKGVAVRHRNAAAFVDAEARLFLQEAPLGVGDRVMAGLSVAFDASCEEMWLAWRYGACLVPAPRSLVRSGMELGPWLVANRITVVSTVPTLLALWPPDSLRRVRLLILGGEACPPELGVRYAQEGRELWNTYGPTEATVVACAALLTGQAPVRIGLPLDGWDLAVVDAEGYHVGAGESGELIIGGVGLARYLDPVKDAEKYAPMVTLGWQRAYRSGDIVTFDPQGLLFAGRADDQIKLGGRRIELGEIDNALSALPGVAGGAAAIRTTKAGNKVLVGYLNLEDKGVFDVASSMATLRRELPEALVPRLVSVETLPTRTSGKIDREALPWPVPTLRAPKNAPAPAGELQLRLAALWQDILGVDISTIDEDFFDLGGGSLTAAQLVSRLRETHPEITVADVYEHPTIAGLAEVLDSMSAPLAPANKAVNPVPRKTQIGQLVALVGLRTLAGIRWLTWLLLAGSLVADLGHPFGALDLPTTSGWVLAPLVLIFLTPPGRLAVSALAARVLLRGLEPGAYPRGGKVHLRLWLAQRIAEEIGAGGLSCAPWMTAYARLLGATVGRGVSLHSAPPVTGMLRIGAGASIEPEVDLTGHWLDGDRLHIGRIVIDNDARIGTRSMLLPGAEVGQRTEIAAGSAVFGEVPADQAWGGAPAARLGPARGAWSDEVPPNKPVWNLVYAASALFISALPVIATIVAASLALAVIGHPHGLGAWMGAVTLAIVPAGILGFLLLTAAIWLVVRTLGSGIEPGHHPIHGAQAWRAWVVLRVLDEARGWLFALYSSALTPAWLRSLGAKIGQGVEASTVLLIPSLVTVADGAFLADDTLVGGYELGGGWLRVDRTKVGKRAFIGNSGMTAPGRRVPKQGLVAVLSAAPSSTLKAKSGSSWLGSPPTQLRRAPGNADDTRTYAPPRNLRIGRALVEACRIVPTLLSVLLGAEVVVVLGWIARSWGVLPAVLLAGVVLLVTGVIAAALSTAAKWALVGRFEVGEHPLWSGFVWCSELADTFVETLAAPWWARSTAGTPALTAWLRTMGAHIGRGVWCETYWLPEADLVWLGDGSTVNQGCVVQTHLFHDRVLSLDEVRLQKGATLGPNSVILPAARLGKHATVGPVSLVMRGESVPDKTRWIGNPIAGWEEGTVSDAD
ncbi:MAG: non-ribosomal peptide synthetase [Marmoricola sp.]